jgi:predicted ester cyclase
MTSTITQRNKQTVWSFWQRLNEAEAGQIPDLVRSVVHQDTIWHGPHPLNDLHGVEALLAEFWYPFLHAFPDVQRRPDIFLGGEFSGSSWVSATGHFTGTFERDWLGIPATGTETYIRFGEFNAVEQNKITETYIILDVLDVMRQAGYVLLENDGGAEGLVAGPKVGDGLLLASQDDQEGHKSLELVKAMVGGMARFDQVDLNTMGMIDYWHPDMRWYGPCGIGAATSLQEFEDFHQRPFLHAFPDRYVANYNAFFGEGAYVAYAGWPCLHFTHRGTYLGHPATDKPVRMRGLDWWKREGKVLVENWVFIDLIDLFLQLGVDLFQVLKEQMAAGRRTSAATATF